MGNDKVDEGSGCFAMDASVQVQGKGPQPVALVASGDRILVRCHDPCRDSMSLVCGDSITLVYLQCTLEGHWGRSRVQFPTSFLRVSKCRPLT
jgi:hypothetical protein